MADPHQNSRLKCQGCTIEVLSKDTDKIQSEMIEIKDLDENIYKMSKPKVLFANAGIIRKCPKCRLHFSKTFKLPEDWWSDYSKRSNGYFGCENIYDSYNKFQSYNTWSRFLVKQVLQYTLSDGKEYIWYKLNFFTKWFPNGQNIIISFETPDILRPKLLGLLKKAPLSCHDPYWFYSLFIHEIIALQDEAVWSVRNLVRKAELSRTLDARPNPHYPRLHDIARHSIHVTESLEVSIITLQNILMQHDRFFTERPLLTEGGAIGPEPTNKKIRFYQHIMESLKCRSQANKERLLSEITLRFNMVAQYDSRISVQIGQAAQVDSSAMKTIAFLTLAFFPATFICALFSTTFFNYTPGTNGEPDVWRVSEKFWVYWVVTIPLSGATVACWLFWHRLFPYKMIGE